MEIVILTKKDFLNFVDSLIKEGGHEIIGPSPKSGRFSFNALETAADLEFDYDETTSSPRKYLLPSREPLLTYTPGDPASYSPVFDEAPRIIIGIHPGDLTAIALLDKAFSTDQADNHYLARRAQTTLIGLFPTREYRYRFTSSMIGEDDPYRAADLMMVDMGDDTYAIELVTEKGTSLISRSGARPADATAIRAVSARKSAVADAVTLAIAADKLPAALEGKERHETFEKRGKQCFGCGSCVLVCPTCFCFDVRDDVDLSLASGTRYRTWDGCIIENFATVAGNHNFRKNASDRLRHRLFRKTTYLKERFGITGCVGCGRCTQACTAGIASIAEMVNDIVGKGN